MKKLFLFVAFCSFYTLKTMECKDRVPQDYYKDTYNDYKNLIKEKDAYIQAKIEEGATTSEATNLYKDKLGRLSHELTKLRNLVEK